MKLYAIVLTRAGLTTLYGYPQARLFLTAEDARKVIHMECLDETHTATIIELNAAVVPPVEEAKA